MRRVVSSNCSGVKVQYLPLRCSGVEVKVLEIGNTYIISKVQIPQNYDIIISFIFLGGPWNYDLEGTKLVPISGFPGSIRFRKLNRFILCGPTEPGRHYNRCPIKI